MKKDGLRLNYYKIGPIVGGLVNRYGERKIVIIGAAISGMAFLLSVASPNIYVFMLIYGGLGGIGRVYSAAITTNSKFYFKASE